MSEPKVYNGYTYTQQADGSWKRGEPVAPQMPADPTFQYQQPQAAANVNKTQTDITKTQTDIVDTREDNRRDDVRLVAELYKQGLRPDGRGGVEAIPNWTPPAGSDLNKEDRLDKNKLAQFRALEAQLARVEELYRQGPGSTSGVSGIADYFPTGTNAKFNSAAAGLGEIGRAAFRVPGSGDQSASELQQFIDANTPSASDKDEAIEEKIRNLRTRLEQTYETLGVQPERDAQGLPNALNYLRTDGGQTNRMEAAGFDATQKAVQFPAEGQAEHDAMVARLITQGGGRLDPQAYAAARAELDRKYLGEEAGQNAESYAAWAGRINDYLEQGGATIPTGIEPTMQDMGFGEQAWNRAASSEMGAGVAGYLNSAVMGVPEMLTGANMDLIREQNPGSTLLGEVGGAITGTAGLGFLGRQGAARLGKEFADTGASRFGRNLATDTTYGAGYGLTTEGDPLTGAALGAVGSAGGQLLGKGAEAAIGGVRLSVPAQAMREAGVRLTPGRILGENASRIEDKMISLPGAGDMIRGRQMDSFTDLNRAMFAKAGEPIGFSPTAIGREGVEQFGRAKGAAYDNATAGVSVPNDPQFFDDLVRTQQLKQALPEEVTTRFDRLMENHTGPITQTGQLSGDAYQRAMRGLKTARGKASTVAGEFEEPYREAVTSGMDAFDGLMRRGGGEDVVQALNRANEGNKNFKIVEDAVINRARNGTRSGEVGLVAPSQLVDAAAKSEAKYGPNSLRELGENAQRVLPSTVPNSGTVDRLALGGLGLAGLGAAGGTEVYATGDASTTATAGGVLAALALLNTRGGNKAFQSIALDRPDSLKRVAEGLRKGRRLFGAAGVPIALTAQ